MKILIQQVWGRAVESTLMTGSQVMLLSKDHILRNEDISYYKLGILLVLAELVPTGYCPFPHTKLTTLTIQTS